MPTIPSLEEIGNNLYPKPSSTAPSVLTPVKTTPTLNFSPAQTKPNMTIAPPVVVTPAPAKKALNDARITLANATKQISEQATAKAAQTKAATAEAIDAAAKGTTLDEILGGATPAVNIKDEKRVLDGAEFVYGVNWQENQRPLQIGNGLYQDAEGGVYRESVDNPGFYEVIREPTKQTQALTKEQLEEQAKTSTTGLAGKQQKLLDDYDKEIESAKSDLDSIRNGTFPLTADQQALLDTTKQRFDALRNELIQANKNYEAAKTTAGIVSGRQMYAPTIEAGNITKAVTDGIARVADLDAKAANALAQMRSGFQEQNYKMIDAAHKNYQDALKNKQTALKDMSDSIAKEEENIRNYNLKLTELTAKAKETFQKDLNDLIKTLGANNAPASLINEVAGSADYAEAVTKAGKYAAGGTGVIGEYYTYARDAEARGETPVDFNTYQNIDANRKAKIAGTSGLPNNVVLQIDKLGSQFDSSPIVKQFNETINKKITVDDIIKNGVGGPADLAIVFEFMKALDPTSVVREAEYDNAAKSGNIFAGAFTKFNGYFKEKGGFLPKGVKEEFKKLVDMKYGAIERQYDNLRNETAKQINRKTGAEDGADYLKDYKISVGDKIREVEDQIANWIASDEKNLTIYDSLVDGSFDGNKYSDADIFEYLQTRGIIE